MKDFRPKRHSIEPGEAEHWALVFCRITATLVLLGVWIACLNYCWTAGPVGPVQ
jgi:hypothetical protein